MCDKLLKVMPAASIYGGPCLLIALALATLEGPSEIASDTFMSRSLLSLSRVGCRVSDLKNVFSLTHIYVVKQLFAVIVPSSKAALL